MLPDFKPGDHLLTFNWGKIKVGDVIVFTSTHDDRRGVYYLKRIDSVDGDSVHVSGDNKKESSQVGLVRQSQIIGKVIFKY